MQKIFRGRKVFKDYGYPAVNFPKHKLSRDNGAVRIHRIIAYEKYGEIPANYHVHHKDGDPWNWEPDNLELLSPSEHAKHHRPNRQKVVCKNCGKVKKAKTSENRKFCSLSCSNSYRYGISWPPVEEVQRLVGQKGFEEVGRKIGCSGNAVRKFLRRMSG